MQGPTGATGPGAAGIGVLTEFTGSGATQFSPLNGYLGDDAASYLVTIDGTIQHPGAVDGAYTIAAANGGTITFASAPAVGALITVRVVRGEVGATGPSGAAGPQGSSGLQGAVGPSGLQGEVGPSGLQGEVGPSGLQGEVGPSGLQGEVGATGATGPGLATTSIAAGTYGSPTEVGAFTVNQFGQLTGATSSLIAISSAQITGVLATSQIPAITSAQIAGVLATSQIPTISTSQISGLAASATTNTTNASNITSGTLATAQLPASGVTPGTYGSSAAIPVLTVDALGRLTLASTASPASGGAQSVKAFINFNGTGTPAIRASLNMSSITDFGVGNFGLTFTSPLASANYVVAGTASVTADIGTASNGLAFITLFLNTLVSPIARVAPSTSNFRIFIANNFTSVVDPQDVCLTVCQ